MEFIPGWYVLYTKSRLENRVAHQLSVKNISLFLPKTKVIRQWHDRRRVVFTPLFPSYIFVLINSIEDHYNSLACEGVINYIRFGKKIARVNDSIITSLRVLLEHSEEIVVSGDKFLPGEKIQIKNGIFAGHICEVVEHKNERKILTRIDLLNRVVLVNLSPCMLN